MYSQNSSIRHESRETIKVLKTLSQSEPRKYQKTNTEQKANKASVWCLLLSLALVALLAMFVYFYDIRPPSEAAKTFVLFISTASVLLALLALIIPVFASLLLLLKWKKLSFKGLCSDIAHEQAIAERLNQYSLEALSDAEFWLERKRARIEERSIRFFGKETAVVGLITATYTFSSDPGNFEIISRALTAGITLESLGDTLILWSAALLVGISIGAVLLEQVAARYKYQTEIIGLVVRQRANQAQHTAEGQAPKCV